MFVSIVVLASICQLISSADKFIWGTATSSYQIEGAVAQDGRTPSIWDTFSEIPGKVVNDETGAIADDSYNRWREDIQLLQNMNISHYRFSISWNRILPDGVTINQPGIDHYRTFIEALLEAGITPYVTLFHWDLPQIIYDQTNGGWINESVVDYFETYASVVFNAYNDIVDFWLTFNEPWTFCALGYSVGTHAPGRCLECTPDYLKGNQSYEVYQCGHNVLLSHGAAVKVFRDNNYNGKIGITLNVDWFEGASNSAEDIAAAERRVIWMLSWFADPVYLGDYPDVMKEYLGDRLPTFTDEQKALIFGSYDFFGMNHYTTKWVKATDPADTANPNWFQDMNAWDDACNQYNNTPVGYLADSDWLWDAPWGTYKILKWIDERYSNPEIYITENGCDVPNENDLSLEDALNDTFRIRFYDGYLTQITRAISTGTNVKAYFAWSLMDNFEWADGYAHRFGLHYVNFTEGANLTRYQKESAKWFSNYANVYNPNAEYKGPTLPPRPDMTDEYIMEVCPTPAPTAADTTTMEPDRASSLLFYMCYVVGFMVMISIIV